jgi:hypothetical protein
MAVRSILAAHGRLCHDEGAIGPAGQIGQAGLVGQLGLAGMLPPVLLLLLP